MTRRKIKVCAIQTGPCIEDLDWNMERALQLLDKSVKEYKPDIVCFNELFNVPFFAVEHNPDASRYYEPIPGKTTNILAEYAKKHKIYIIAGLAEEPVAGERYNSAVLINDEGGISGLYRKMQIPLFVSPPHKQTFEKNYFRDGNLGFPVFDTAHGRIGILICYDRHFPEAFRTLVLKGAEIIFIPTGARTWNTNWRAGMWESLLRTRAYENGVFLVVSNRSGTEGKTTYLGKSVIISPIGAEILAMSNRPDDDIVYAELDLSNITRAREELPVFRDRRPEAYQYLMGTSLF